MYSVPNRTSPTVVAVTRMAGRSAALTDLLVERGLQVVGVPVIAVDPPADAGAALRQSLADVGPDDLVVVTSAHGVAAVESEGGLPADVAVAAVGAATATAARDAGWATPIIPQRQLARALAATIVELRDPCRVVFAAALGAGPDIEDVLGAAGFDVQRVEAYRTNVHRPPAAVIDAASRCDLVTFTSGSTVRGWIEIAGTTIPGVSIGPSTSAVARHAGQRIVGEADPHDLDGLVAAVMAVVQ